MAQSYLYLLHFLLLLTIECSKLNERRLLLPYNSGVATNFTLEATDDTCYQWSSSRVDVATVSALEDHTNHCSKGAVVSVVSRLPKRQSTVVTATDVSTGSVIRCDVEIDMIDNIEIITKTREIVLEDLPESLEVRAKNVKVDTFTTIGGLQFEWTLTPVDILRYKTWSSSSYIAPPFVQYWESRDAKGSIILVEGIRTGSAKVMVRVMGDNYQKVKPHEITLHVIANLGLIPPHDVYIIMGSVLKFKAEMRKQGPKVEVTLPSLQYYLQILDSSVAKLDEQTSEVEALKEGHTSLLLRDRNVAATEDTRQPTTDIHVVNPSYLAIHVTPGENFALCELISYIITFTVHDDYHHRLYSTDNLKIEVDFPERFFYPNSSTTNGSYNVVHTIKAGNTKIGAKLVGAGRVKLATPITFTQDITIYPALKIIPSLIVLPWIGESKPSYTVYANAVGATGHYVWLTNNSVVATVNYRQEQSSRVTIITRGEGDANITCHDGYNTVFTDYLRVSVQRLADIEILPSIVETHINGEVILPIAIYGYEDSGRKLKRIFDDCTRIPLNVSIIEKNRLEYDANKIVAGLRRSCRSLSFKCVSNGNSRIWIEYNSINKEESLKTTAIIGCHSPLVTLNPEKVAVLALGASIDVAFEGGPRPWSSFPKGHYSRLVPSNPDIISFEKVVDPYRRNKDLHVFQVKCVKYGETIIELDVGNIASDTLPNPARANAEIKIICARPSSLVIRPKLKNTCPLSAPQDSVFTVEKNANIEIEIDVIDNLGQSFYNISTLKFDWNLEGVANFENIKSIKEEVNGAKGYFAITRNYQVLKEVRSNSIKISAEITGYKEEYRDKFSIKSDIKLMLVDKASVDHEKVSILNHPNNKVNFYISNGSGYFSIDLELSHLVNTTFNQQSKQIEVVPKQLGHGVITITDLCLPTYSSAEIELSVVEMAEIRVEILDKVQLGSTVVGYLTVIDNNGQIMHVTNHHFLNIKPFLSNRVISVSNFSIFNDEKSSFQVKGEELGFGDINFLSYITDVKTIESDFINIQVFSPLRIIPSNITVIIGNHFQVTCTGGPQPQRSIEYVLADDKIARVDNSGLIVGSRIGSTTLIARVLSINEIEYSRAEIQVFVILLNKIKILCASSQVQVGATLPLILLGSNEHETPFSFGLSTPSLKIKWTVSNENTAAIENVFEGSGIIEDDLNSVSVRLRAKSSGIVTVNVKVEERENSYLQIIDNKVLSDTIHIQVFPVFALTSSGNNIEGQVILMSPNSELPLMSNRDGVSETEYRLLDASNVKLSCGHQQCLKAGENSETASMIARTKEKFGVTQTAFYGIRVDTISYMMVKPVNSFPLNNLINVFPVGSDLELSVTYHHNIGRIFNALLSQIKWIVSQNDIISVSHGSLNNTLKIHFLKEGKVIVRVFDEINNISDYFTINVGFIIQPSNVNINMGEFVCFFTKLRNNIGLWHVENSLIGDIEKDSGIFVARSSGQTRIGWNSTQLSTYTRVNVSLLSKFYLDATNIDGITNTISLSIPIVIIGQSKNIEHRGCLSHSLAESDKHNTLDKPFSCELTFENGVYKQIWNTDVRIDLSSGHWLCVISPKPDIEIDFSEMSLINTNVSISAFMILKTREFDARYPSLVSEVNVPFLPAFYLSLKQVMLTIEEPNSRISVHSVQHILENLIIVPSNADVIGISKSTIESNTLKLTIYLKSLDLFSNDISNLHVLLSSKVTKQSERIAVQIKLSDVKSHVRSIFTLLIQEYSSVIWTTILAVIILVFSYWLVSKTWHPSSPTPAIALDLQSSPFAKDIHSPSFAGHRALNYSTSTPTPSSSSPTRVGRPLYTLRDT